MRRLALAVLAIAIVAAAACKSSAPYTVPSAAINTAIALGAAGVQRAQGGCYAVCTHGMVCNPETGLCEAAPANAYCEEAPGGGIRCVPLQVGKERQPAQPTFPLGVSPATGSVPPPANEASPRGP
jgi:hypothetical protein